MIPEEILAKIRKNFGLMLLKCLETYSVLRDITLNVLLFRSAEVFKLEQSRGAAKSFSQTTKCAKEAKATRSKRLILCNMAMILGIGSCLAADWGKDEDHIPSGQYGSRFHKSASCDSVSRAGASGAMFPDHGEEEATNEDFGSHANVRSRLCDIRISEHSREELPPITVTPVAPFFAPRAFEDFGSRLCDIHVPEHFREELPPITTNHVDSSSARRALEDFRNGIPLSPSRAVEMLSGVAGVRENVGPFLGTGFGQSVIDQVLDRYIRTAFILTGAPGANSRFGTILSYGDGSFVKKEQVMNYLVELFSDMDPFATTVRSAVYHQDHPEYRFFRTTNSVSRENQNDICELELIFRLNEAIYLWLCAKQRTDVPIEEGETLYMEEPLVWKFHYATTVVLAADFDQQGLLVFNSISFYPGYREISSIAFKDADALSDRCIITHGWIPNVVHPASPGLLQFVRPPQIGRGPVRASLIPTYFRRDEDRTVKKDRERLAGASARIGEQLATSAQKVWRPVISARRRKHTEPKNQPTPWFGTREQPPSPKRPPSPEHQ